jgi:hypothetical protein
MDKQEIIKGIRDLEVRIDWITFEQNQYETVEITKQIETDNYWIDLEFEVTVKFESYDFYEVDNVELLDFAVSSKLDGSMLISEYNLGWYFTEDEITNEINIEL